MTTFTDERRLNWEQAKAELLRISTSRGDNYVYPGYDAATCHYRWDLTDVDEGRAEPEEVGQAACLIGQAMDDWGLLADLIPPKDEGYFEHNYDAVGEMLSPEVIPVEKRDWPWVRSLFVCAQSNQDTGMAWPLAVRNAIATVDVRIGAVPEDERPQGWAPHQWSQ